MAGFLTTATGRIPQVRTTLTWRDRLGTCRARLGLDRNRYTVNPGLYAVGTPDASAPVIVTANYKLTFDAVRTALVGQNLWLLVADTRGINVWCAGGKELFSARTIIDQIRKTGLHKVITHKRLILPQLGANGVNAREIRKATGFEAEFGPVRAQDIDRYLKFGADEAMREVTFTLRERAEVIPVELMFGGRPVLWAFAAALLLSLIGPELSIPAIWTRWLPAAMATLLGVLGGTVLFPCFCPCCGSDSSPRAERSSACS